MTLLLPSPSCLLCLNKSNHEELRVAEIQCKICKFRNKVYPRYSSDYEFKPSSTPCPGKGYLADFKCLGCLQPNRVYWCLD
jgi:hypothetical protein